MLEVVAPDMLWTVRVPLRFYGIGMGARMTVCRLSDGALWVHSPIGLEPCLGSEIDSLGTVRHVIAPSRLHHLFLTDFLARYPDAGLYGSPALPKKRPDLRFDGILGNTPQPGWAADLDQRLIRSDSLFDEVVFFHRRSRTLIVADLLERADETWPPLSRLIYRLMGLYQRAGPPIDMKLLLSLRRRAETRASVDKILSWDFDRLIMSHGALIDSGAKDVVRRAFRFAVA
jgi:hypothetical protein